MKFIAITTSLIVVFLITHYIDSSSIPKLDDQKNIVSNDIKELIPLPNFNFTNLEGKKLSIDDFKGKVIILNFWASWCGPCEQEFPEMAKIVSSNKDTVLVAISNDEERKDIDKFLKRLKKEYPKLENDRIIFAHDKYKEISTDYFNVLRLPETFIVNSQFKILRKVIGSQEWLDGSMTSFINELFKK
ncbi:MAG: TlpA family protein disulfide reductase [Halobacteriovoraceae bacterium]|nr:TlpA family protein disulfide reductase [Halobacteriovoraceae bacterium]